MAASPSKRRRILVGSAPVLAALARETARGSGADGVNAAATVVASVAKREGKARERYLGGAKAAAAARGVRVKKVCSSAAPGPADRDADLVNSRAPGLMLVRLGCVEARRKSKARPMTASANPPQAETAESGGAAKMKRTRRPKTMPWQSPAGFEQLMPG